MRCAVRIPPKSLTCKKIIQHELRRVASRFPDQFSSLCLPPSPCVSRRNTAAASPAPLVWAIQPLGPQSCWCSRSACTSSPLLGTPSCRPLSPTSPLASPSPPIRSQLKVTATGGKPFFPALHFPSQRVSLEPRFVLSMA